MHRLLATVLLGLSLMACQPGYRASSPEVLYSKEAGAAAELQIPPDLTELSEGEQFVLPGTTGAAITRNTLLPETASVRFVRSGEENYLEIQRAPEDVWPQLQAFLRSERYPIAKTEPVAGVMTTQWRELSDAEGRSALKNLLGNDITVSRVALRIERASSASTRLFARRQVAANSDAEVGPSDVWPASSHDPENTSELLVRLMVFLGVQEQKARGILSDSAVSSVLDDATLETTSSETSLVVHRGYRPAFRAVNAAIDVLYEGSVSSDSNLGRVSATLADATVSYTVTPVNISAARVTVKSTKGLTRSEQQALLNALRDQLV